MKKILTDKMLHDIFTALEKGETFEYTDDNTQISINPHGISIQHHSSSEDIDIEDFLRYCDNLDDDLFIATCESFDENELEELQKQLDTPNYKETIKTFKDRAKKIAKELLSKIEANTTAGIAHYEAIIADAYEQIGKLSKERDEAYVKYSI